jgi:hypothetical protein
MEDLVRIVFTQNTVIKQSPIDSSQLPSYQYQAVPVGTCFVLQSYASPSFDTRNHYRFNLKNLQIKGYSTNWYAFAQYTHVMNQPFYPVRSLSDILYSQSQQDVVKISVSIPPSTRQGFLKLVFNTDTVIKRSPVDSNLLNDQSKQSVPAGTELILLTSAPDAGKTVSFPIEDKHVKVTLKDLELKGYSQDWYAFVEHVGIQPVG